MAQIQLVVSVFITLSVLMPGQAHNCFSKEHGCDMDEIKRTVDRLVVPNPTPGLTSSSKGCQASSEGTESQRSVSPWGYSDNFNDTRYPHTLREAKCSCNFCISLKNFTEHGHKRIYKTTEQDGNSVPVTHTIRVFYRRSCPMNPTRFYLEPQKYNLTVACICLASRRS